MRRSTTGFLAVLVVSGSAFAAPPADLAAAFQEAAKAKNPPAAFWRNVASMPDFTVSGDELRRAVEAGGSQAVDPLLASLVLGTRSFSKKGDQISFDVAPGANGGATSGIVTGQSVRFRLVPQGDDMTIDAVRGVTLPGDGSATPSMDRVKFRADDAGKPVMDVTGSVGNRSVTSTIDLAQYGIVPGSGNVGMVGRLDGVAGTASKSSTQQQAADVAPTTSADVATTTSAANGAKPSTSYTIEMGDTLWDIGQAYGMTVDQLLDYDGGTGVTNRERLAKTAKSARHRGDPDWIWHPQEILLPTREGEAPTPKRHTWNR